MPARISLSLNVDATPPDETGHRVNAALLAAIRADHPDLAARMHESSPKLYGITPILDADDDPHVEIGLLDDSVVQATVDSVANLAEIRIDEVSAQIRAVDVYPVDAEIFVEDPDPSAGWQLRFITPCLLANDAFPTPGILLRSLAWRGRAFMPELPDQRAVERLASVLDARYELALDRHLVKVVKSRDGGRRGAFEQGFVGSAEVFCLERATRTDRARISGLLGLGSFAGVGRHTAVGMGVLRVTPG